MYRETILSLFLARVEYLFAFPFFSIRFAKTHWEEGEAKIIFFKIFGGGRTRALIALLTTGCNHIFLVLFFF